jgi:hypothetical protein
VRGVNEDHWKTYYIYPDSLKRKRSNVMKTDTCSRKNVREGFQISNNKFISI